VLSSLFFLCKNRQWNSPLVTKRALENPELFQIGGYIPEYPKTFTNISNYPKLYQTKPTGFQVQLATIMLRDDRGDIWLVSFAEV
jgi:hypothetical protein